MHLVNEYGLPLAALLVFVTELGIPSGIPNEIPLLLIGAYHIHSVLALLGAIAVVSIADLSGTTGLFLIIHSGGNRLANRLLRGHSGERALEKWRTRIGKSTRRDIEIVVSGRLLPMVRTPFTIAMALLRMRTRHFLLGAIPGAILWASWPLVLGYVLRHRVEQVIDPIEQGSSVAGIAVVILLAIAILAVVVRGRLRTNRQAGAR